MYFLCDIASFHQGTRQMPEIPGVKMVYNTRSKEFTDRLRNLEIGEYTFFFSARLPGCLFEVTREQWPYRPAAARTLAAGSCAYCLIINTNISILILPCGGLKKL